MINENLQTLGKEFEKEVIVDGEKILKTLICTEISEYDTDGNLIHTKNNSGKEIWYDYDKNGNCIYQKDNKGFELWCEYDEKGNLICKKDNKDYNCTYEYEYDKNGNLVYWKNSDGDECWKAYDKKGKLVDQVKEGIGSACWQRMINISDKELIDYELESNEFESSSLEVIRTLKSYDYDINGNITESNSYIPDTEVYVGAEFYEYDEKGCLTYKKCTEEDDYVVSEEFFEYEFYPAGNKKVIIKYESIEDDGSDEFDEY